MPSVKLLSSVLAALVVSACAHPLVIEPELSRVTPSAAAQPIARNVGYYLAPELREKVVTTGGGGGDSVTYSPYRNMETGLYKMLGNVFTKVTLMKSAKDAEVIARDSISYVITPEIITSSSSPSALTWPPTKFTVDLTCNISDPDGKFVAKTTVTGVGQAEFDEFKSDFSLSGKRAALDALVKMQEALLNTPALRQP